MILACFTLGWLLGVATIPALVVIQWQLERWRSK